MYAKIHQFDSLRHKSTARVDYEGSICSKNQSIVEHDRRLTPEPAGRPYVSHILVSHWLLTMPTMKGVMRHSLGKQETYKRDSNDIITAHIKFKQYTY